VARPPVAPPSARRASNAAGSSQSSTILNELRAKRAEAELFPVCLDVRLHAAHDPAGLCRTESPRDGSTPSRRPRPLPADMGEALAIAAETDPTTEGLRLLLQVRADRERILGWRPSASWPVEIPPPQNDDDRASASNARPAGSESQAGLGRSSARTVPPDRLARMTLSLQVPLVLARAVAVQIPRTVEEAVAAAAAAAEARSEAWSSPKSVERRTPTSRDGRDANGASPGVAIILSSSSEAVSALQALKLGKEAGDSEEGLWLFVCESVADQVDILEQLQLAGCIMHDISSRYSVGELVGAGASSKVFLAENLSTAEEVAVKIVSKKTPKDDIALFKEATILRWAVHESVLQYRAIYEIEDPATGQEAWAIVTEFVGGGELFEEVRQNGPLSEDRTMFVIGQLLSALDFLHTRGIVHRDIKTENVCKTGYSDEIKLVDFGLAAPEWDSEAMQMRCGTPGYIAPEVLKSERYGCKVDCFSVGVLMYILLVGYGPFRGQTLEEMLLRNAKCKVDLQVLSHLSESATDLAGKLLAAKAVKRPSAQEGLAHEWMKAFQPATSVPTSRGSTTYPGGVAAAAQAAAMAVADREMRAAEPTSVLASAALDATSSSTSSVRRARRRLFSVSLSGMDMFFRDLKFSDGNPDDPDVDGVPATVNLDESSSSAAPSPPLPMPPAATQPHGKGTDDREESIFVLPPPPAPPCAVPTSPSTPAPPLHMDRPSTPDSPGLLPDNSFGDCGQEPAPLPHTIMDDDDDDVAARGNASPSGHAQPQGRQPSKGSQDSGEDEALVVAQVSGVEFRTCEPLWAGVQRTLENKRGQGVLPAGAGVKNVALRKRYADIMNGRAEAQNDEEAQRVSAFYTRDLRKKQSFSHSECSAKQLQVERVTAFFMRDLGQHADETTPQYCSQEAGNAFAAELAERQSFNSAGSPPRAPLFPSEGVGGQVGATGSGGAQEVGMQAVPSYQSMVSVPSEERTSAFFTRWGAENRQASAEGSSSRRPGPGGPPASEDGSFQDPHVQNTEYLSVGWNPTAERDAEGEMRKSFA